MGVRIKSLIISKKINLDDLKGKSVAIDGMNMLFQILYNPIQKQKKLTDYFYMDSTQRVITHIYGWLQKISNLFRYKIMPIVVFDGKPDNYKRLSSKNIANDYLAAETMYKSCLKKGDLSNAKNHALSRSYMFTNCVHESKSILEFCGIPVIMAPSEAEAQCVELQKQGIVDYVISNDYDVLLYGASNFIQKLTFQTRIKVNNIYKTIKPDINLINLDENLKMLNITRRQLIDLSILIGNDYFRGINGIGVKKALESIHYYGNIDNMINKYPEKFKNISFSKLNKIRNLFTNPITINFSAENLLLKPFNKIALSNLCLNEHSLNKERIKKKIIMIEKRFQKFAQFLQLNPNKLNYSFKTNKKFNIHLQRRLNRAKSRNKKDFKPNIEFISADQINKT